jgi:hypothetical protein
MDWIHTAVIAALLATIIYLQRNGRGGADRRR